jgi:Leucine-rich repeat (LRR) protein
MKAFVILTFLILTNFENDIVASTSKGDERPDILIISSAHVKNKMELEALYGKSDQIKSLRFCSFIGWSNDLIPEIFKKFKNLKELDLSGLKIGNEGAKVLGKILIDLPKLESLNLRFNGIKDFGAIAIADGFSANKILTGLNLKSNEIGPYGLNAINHALKNRKSRAKVLTSRNLV